MEIISPFKLLLICLLIQLVVYPTLGTLATQTITPMNGCPITTFHLGHFAERAGQHYVCLMDDVQETRPADTPHYNVRCSLRDEHKSDQAEESHGNREPDKQNEKVTPEI